MVSVLAFYSNDPSSNPTEVYNFSVQLKRTKVNKNMPGLAHFKNYTEVMHSDLYNDLQNPIGLINFSGTLLRFAKICL